MLLGCNAVKYVPEDKHLLTENTILVDGEETDNSAHYKLLTLEPNSRLPLLGTPLGLHIYNASELNPAETYVEWLDRKPGRRERMNRIYSAKQVAEIGRYKVGFNQFLQNTGQAPAVITNDRIEKSKKNLYRWFWNHGYFNAEVNHEKIVDTTAAKRAALRYEVNAGTPYVIDSITKRIDSKVADSLYRDIEKNSRIVPGKQYLTLDFNAEQDRVTNYFRNHGLYHWSKEYLRFEADTVNTNNKVNVAVVIKNRPVRLPDTTLRIPFKVHRISKVNVVTDYLYEFRNDPYLDSANQDGYNIYSHGRMRYNPKVIADAIFIKPGDVYRDIDRTRTYNRVAEYRTFKYPTIEYVEDLADTTGSDLIANVYLTPQKKRTVQVSADVRQSTIQTIGIGGNLSWLARNVFKGAELLELSARGSIGASRDATDGRDDGFFDITELGVNMSLYLPRILFPIETDKLIPKFYSPQTQFNVGFANQRNIGLDRQSVNGALSYRWKPNTIKSSRFDLVNVEYIRNLNPEAYFQVYRNTFDVLNAYAQETNYIGPDAELGIPGEARQFINDVAAGNVGGLTTNDERIIGNIEQRRQRLSENNLIVASSYTWVRDNRVGLFDQDFSRIRARVEVAGNTLSALAGLAGVEEDDLGRQEVFGVAFSQYAKFELEYFKHWSYGNDVVFAIRAFGGVALPYGNSNSIPFSRSFFAGGSNDNRAWRPYDLGPGVTDRNNEFNEANMKLATNAELRFPIAGEIKGAIFVDAGNIWNVADNVTDPDAVFEGFADLAEISVGTGFGIRYDLSFFVIRLDIGFKTYDPVQPKGLRWAENYNFANAVYNVGINYPF